MTRFLLLSFCSNGSGSCGARPGGVNSFSSAARLKRLSPRSWRSVRRRRIAVALALTDGGTRRSQNIGAEVAIQRVSLNIVSILEGGENVSRGAIIVVGPVDGVVEGKIVVKGGIGGEGGGASILGVDAVVTVADQIVADIKQGLVDGALIARAHQDGHVGLIDGVVVDMNVVGGVPQLNGDGALVVDEVVVDAGIGIAALVAADGVEGIAVVEETAARGDVAKDVVMHAAGATGVMAVAPRGGG